MAKSRVVKHGCITQPIDLSGYISTIKASNVTGKVTIEINFGKKYDAIDSFIFSKLQNITK